MNIKIGVLIIIHYLALKSKCDLLKKIRLIFFKIVIDLILKMYSTR